MHDFKRHLFLFHPPGWVPLLQIEWLGDSDEHGAVSIGSPLQAAAEGALAQWRNLDFLAQEQEGSHSDHWPQSAQTPAAVDIMSGPLLNRNTGRRVCSRTEIGAGNCALGAPTLNSPVCLESQNQFALTGGEVVWAVAQAEPGEKKCITQQKVALVLRFQPLSSDGEKISPVARAVCLGVWKIEFRARHHHGWARSGFLK